MFRVKRIITIVLFAAGLYGCKKQNEFDLVKSTGPDRTDIRHITAFNKVILDDKIDVYLAQGPFEVKVIAGRNLLSNIITEAVEDSTLKIHDENKFNFIRSQSRRIRVYVTAPHIYHIWNLGVGTYYCNGVIQEDTIRTRSESSGDIHLNVNVNYLNTSSHGNGDVYVSGHADVSYHYMYGTNYLFMQDCSIQNYIFIETISSGYAKIQAPLNGPIEANIWESGNIYYTGNPTYTSYQRHAKGDLIKD